MSPVFGSYNDAATFFSKARLPQRGRPLMANCRLRRDGKEYTIMLESAWITRPIILCRISPDNTVTLMTSVDDLRYYAQTISNVLRKCLKMHLVRIAKGTYRIGTEQGRINAAGGSNVQYYWSFESQTYLRKQMPQYFQYIQFDLGSGECRNPRPDERLTSNPEVRTQWLRDLRRYKRGLHARIKVGALDYAIALPWIELRSRAGDFSMLERRVVECMREDIYPEEVLMGLVFYARRNNYFWPGIVAQDKKRNIIEQFFTRNSIELRRLYGVFAGWAPEN